MRGASGHGGIVAIVALIAMSAMSGAIACGHARPQPPYAPQPTSALVVVPHEPPPARVESVPPAPTATAVWIDGEWSLRHRRWTWVPGRWVEPPPRATYSPWVTVRGEDGTLYFAPAVWRDARGEVIDAPRPLVVGTVESGAVVDPEGEVERTTVAPPR